jgi:hypothetical protein
MPCVEVLMMLRRSFDIACAPDQAVAKSADPALAAATAYSAFVAFAATAAQVATFALLAVAATAALATVPETLAPAMLCVAAATI